MIKRSLVILLFIFSTAFAFSQSKREWMAHGDAAFKNEDYKSAIDYYLKVLDQGTSVDLVYPYTPRPYIPPKKGLKDSLKAAEKDTLRKISPVSPMEQYVTHQLADAYRLNHDYANAETWFKKSVENKPADYPFERFWYADALMKNRKYPAAQIEFDKVMTEAEKKDSTYFQLAKIKIAGCYLATDSLNNRKDLIVKEMDSLFNAGTSSFAVNYYGDASTIQFTSGRATNKVADPKKDAEKAKYTADIYTLKKSNDNWTELKKVEGPADTEMNEGAGFLTLDKANYYFTRWSTTNKNECGIYLSKLFNDKWAPAEKLNDNVNLEGYKSMQPALSPDGSILYFSSNRPGGMGKMDLWYVNIDEEGRPSGKPVNMGKLFNTAEDEVTPFFHYYTSTLYYSSNGLAGYGGLDVFKSTYNSDSLWTAPKNMGSPINSSKDDSYFVLDRSQRQGFLSSDRKDCADCGSCYKIYSVDKEPNVYDLKGTVYNADNNQVIANSLLTFKDIRGDKEPFYLITDSLGNYFTVLEEGWELYIKAQKNKFFGDAGNITTFGLTESMHFEKDFFLSPIPQGDIVIPGIEYDYDKATLRPASKKILDDLVDFLNLNNNLSVEISSHTDARGSDSYNLKLSQERAKSVVDYLVEKGIKADRLNAQGYGEQKLLVPNASTEEEHQKNRRTAFRPIKEGVIQAK